MELMKLLKEKKITHEEGMKMLKEKYPTVVSDDEEEEIEARNAEVGWDCSFCYRKPNGDQFAYHEVRADKCAGTLCLECYDKENPEGFAERLAKHNEEAKKRFQEMKAKR